MEMRKASIILHYAVSPFDKICYCKKTFKTNCALVPEGLPKP